MNGVVEARCSTCGGRCAPDTEHEFPQIGQIWRLRTNPEDSDNKTWPPVLILSRDDARSRWIICDETGQKMSLWDGTLWRYRRCTHRYWSHAKRAALAKGAKW